MLNNLNLKVGQKVVVLPGFVVTGTTPDGMYAGYGYSEIEPGCVLTISEITTCYFFKEIEGGIYEYALTSLRDVNLNKILNE
jgi:hypothetical protein